MRLPLCFVVCLATRALVAQQPSLPDAPSYTLLAAAASAELHGEFSSSDDLSDSAAAIYDYSFYPVGYEPQNQTPLTPEQQAAAAQAARRSDPRRKQPPPVVDLDANGNPIPLNRQQPQRILGFMPNFRSVSAGSKPHAPGWKYNFKVATHQSFDYSSFIFLGITSLSAEGLNSHPVLRKGIGGFYAYTWRGLLDKTDGTYLGAWLLPSLLHEDTRFFPLGDGHKIMTRALYVISRQGVARTYGGHQTPNIAGLGGKVLTQVISRYYYPTGATSFSVLATKFAYAAMRDIAFTSVREFYPDIAAHYIKKHREKLLRLQQQQSTPPHTPEPANP